MPPRQTTVTKTLTSSTKYQQVHRVADQVNKNDILIIQGDCNAKIGKDARQGWKEYIGLPTNERGLRLLEFAIFNDIWLWLTLKDNTGN